MKRGFKHIIVATNSEAKGEFRERLYAVADDDTLWRFDDPDAHTSGVRGSGKWKQLPTLPDGPEPASQLWVDDDDDEGCPKGDPDCESPDDGCHDACESPAD